MKRVFIGLGSNLGQRKENLELALGELAQLSSSGFSVSPVLETNAILPEGKGNQILDAWDLPYLNVVVELSYSRSPEELLSELMAIEKKMGRVRLNTWEPRIIDLDILWFEGEVRNSAELQIPHAGLLKRSFLLDALLLLSPQTKLYGEHSLAVDELARQQKIRNPNWMSIVNVTPDSFSDGGEFLALEKLETHLQQIDSLIGYVDIGAESTRPGAQPLEWQQEWNRLKPTLEFLRDRYRGNYFRPKISVDTRFGETAFRAIEFGADLINDVSGLTCPVMKELLTKTSIPYVLTHSLSVPAKALESLPCGEAPILLLKNWFERKLSELQNLDIDTKRFILDPGLGFGKNKIQTRNLLTHLKELKNFKLPLLVGHSRKSFLKSFAGPLPLERDAASVGVSLQLARQGIDFIRVHNPLIHQQAWRAYSHFEPQSENSAKHCIKEP